MIKRANFILDKGTNRLNFIKNFRKKIISANKNNKFYSWVDVGSEYRAPELSSALLYSQLKKIDKIQRQRKKIWLFFKKEIKKLNTNLFRLLVPDANSESSYHLFVIIFNSSVYARKFMEYMQKRGIAATFHYVPLHKSKMASKNFKQRLKITENIYNKIVRLPLFVEMNEKIIKKINSNIKSYVNEQKK